MKRLALICLLALALTCTLAACDSHTHDDPLVHHEAKAPTCTQSGTIEYWECTGCGKYFDSANGADGNELDPADLTVAATGHNFDGADYVSDGASGHYQLCRNNCGTRSNKTAHDTAGSGGVCSKCGYDPAHVHDSVLLYHAPNDPTCTEAGNEEYWECATCHTLFDAASGGNEVQLEDVTVAKLDHDYEDAAYVSDGEQGHHRICNRCEQPSATETHTYDNDQICSNCGYADVNYTGTPGFTFRWDIDGYAAIQTYGGTETNVVVPQTVTRGTKQYTIKYVMYNAFNFDTVGAKLTTVRLPDSVVTVGDDAFQGQDELQWVLLGSGLTYLNDAFGGTSDGLKVFYNGSAADFANVNNDENNLLNLYGKLHFYSLDAPTAAGRYWHFADSTPVAWPNGTDTDSGTAGLVYSYDNDSATAAVTGYNGQIANVVIPAVTVNNETKYKVTSIARNAFESTGSSPIESVIIPDTVTEIKDRAFYGQQLQWIVYGKGIVTVGTDVFGGSGSSAFKTGATIYFADPNKEYAWDFMADSVIPGWYTLTPQPAVSFFSNTQPQQPGNYWHWTEGVPTPWEPYSGGTDTPVTPDVPDSGYTLKYTITDEDEAVITGAEGSGDYVVIPKSIEDNMLMYPVTAIDDYAFEEMDLQWILFGSNITRIGEDAFSYAFIEDDEGGGTLTIYFDGTSEDWAALVPNIAGYSNPYGPGFSDYTKVYIRSDEQPQTEGDYWYYGADNMPTVWTNEPQPSAPQGTPGLKYTYNDEEATATVTGYDGTSKNVVIPSTITDNGDVYTVTAIGESAFDSYEDCSAITTCIIPDTVTSIGAYAFQGQALDWIVIGSGVQSVGEGAFADVYSSTDDEGFYIYYAGTQEQWNQLKPNFTGYFGEWGGGVQDSSKLYVYSETETSGNYWHYSDAARTQPTHV